MGLIDDVKLSLRIKHTSLDSDITTTILTARAELIRSGINETKANGDDDVLINQAIKTYALMWYSDDEKKKEGYEKSWSYQIDNLRKSSGYRKSDSNE